MSSKRAYKITGDLDRCHYRGDISKCATCQQEPQKFRDDWGKEYVVLTICQLYAKAGTGPTGRRRRIAVMVACGIAGLSAPLLVRLLT